MDNKNFNDSMGVGGNMKEKDLFSEQKSSAEDLRETQEFYKSEKADIVSDEAGTRLAILSKIRKEKPVKREDVVYGIYNNADKGSLARLNDFLIDHTKVSLRDKSYFFHMLAVMVDAGIPLIVALKSLSARTDNLRFARVLNTIAYNIEQGSSLSDSMKRYEDVFDESEIGIVKSGEAIGQLDKMLFKLSEKLDSRHELNMKLVGASIYPLVVLGVLLVVATIMMVWVFPTLVSLFVESGVGVEKLPVATRALIYVQDFTVNFWWLILILIFGVYGLFLGYVGTDYGRLNWDYFKLKVPFIGALLKKVYVLRFVDLLGLLIEAGVPVIKSLEIVGNSFTNTTYRLITQEIIESVRRGEKISNNMAKYSVLFPSEVVEMIRTGESSASVGKVSDKIAVQYGKEIDNALKRVASVFEPILIVVVGLFVAMLAMAIMGPIFNLGSTLG